MKAMGYRFQRFGVLAEQLKLQDYTVATPQSGVAVVRLLAAPLHRADYTLVAGALPKARATFPATAGLEGVGIVESLGSGPPPGLTVGARVWVSDASAGTWSTHTSCNAAALTLVPSDVPVDLAAMSGLWYLAASLLTNTTKLVANDVVLVAGGSSAVAAAVAALGGSRGLRVVLACESEASQAAAKERVSDVVGYSIKGARDLKAILKGGPGVKLFINGVGGAVSNEFMKLVGEGGHVVAIGAQKGYGMMWATSKHFYGDITLSGYYLPKALAATTSAQRAETLAPMYALIKAKKLTYPCQRFPLDKGLDAFKNVTMVQRGVKAILRQDGEK